MRPLDNEGLRLTEDEADALLGLALASPAVLDVVSSSALEKLARYCAQRCVRSHPLAELGAVESIPAGA